MTIKRNGSAVWSGGLKDGKGAVSTGSGVLKDSQYGFNTRFEDGPGTNPEELIGAAHAGCFSMALSHALSENGTPPERVNTSASVTFKPGTGITGSHLNVNAVVPGITPERFAEIAQGAKVGCPVSQALAGIEITLEASLA